MRLNLFIVGSLVLLTACKQGSRAPQAMDAESSLKKGVVLVDYSEKQKVDVYIDGDIFTSYIYPPDIGKPVLFPVRSASGTIVTRGYPIDSGEGELADHPREIGIWFDYGDVNGLDFRDGSYFASEEEPGAVRILHTGVKRAESRNALGVLEVNADWQVPVEGTGWHTLLQETAIFEFSGDGNTRTIDRTTWLTAQEDDVNFGESGKGMLAIRTDRAFAFPSDSPRVFTSANGLPSDNAMVDNEGMNGHFYNSEGLEDEEVNNRQAGWVALSAMKGEEKITIAVFDHPENPGYPAYWLAGENGLLSVNNLERHNLNLKAGESVVFRHRIFITSGYFADRDELNRQFSEFSR